MCPVSVVQDTDQADARLRIRDGPSCLDKWRLRFSAFVQYFILSRQPQVKPGGTVLLIQPVF